MSYRFFFSKSSCSPLNLWVISHKVRKQQQQQKICDFPSAGSQKNKMADFWCKNCLFLQVELMDLKMLSIKWVILTSGMWLPLIRKLRPSAIQFTRQNIWAEGLLA